MMLKTMVCHFYPSILLSALLLLIVLQDSELGAAVAQEIERSSINQKANDSIRAPPAL